MLFKQKAFVILQFLCHVTRAATADDQVKLITDRLEKLEHQVHFYAKRADHLERKLEAQEVALETKCKAPRDSPFPEARGYVDTNIAFTSYLDADIDNLGASQTIVFDQVLLNDGDAYSQHTGAFVAPFDGVYSFHFFVGQRHVNQLFVSLTVNGHLMVEAVVETIAAAQDLQGGNSAVLKLIHGDTVQVRHDGVGSHIEGGVTKRITTFSGYLIYPTDYNVPVG